MTSETHKGSCMCGAVQIEAAGNPEWTATCHCIDCRHATGAASAAFAGYLAAKASVSGSCFSEFESSPGMHRGFCTKCGTRLTCRGDRWPDQLHLHVGIMEDAEAFAPLANVYVKDKLSWVHLEPELPALQETSAE